MRKIGFNPFDESSRDKRPRRRSEEVLADKRNRQEKIDAEMRRILENYNCGDYIDAASFLNFAAYSSEYFTAIKRNLNTAMGRLGYVKMMAETSDGRWFLDGVNTNVYKRVEKPDLTFSQLKEYFR